MEKWFLWRFNENFIKNYNENSNVGYFLEVDIEYPNKLWSFHKDLPFLPERKKLEKVEKLVCSIEDKEKYVIHIRALKQALKQASYHLMSEAGYFKFPRPQKYAKCKHEL